MYDTNVIILADLKEFPHAQHYAECFSVLFSDIGRRDLKKSYKPDRQDYIKVYIASKNAELVSKFKESHSAFNVEVFDDVPDYTGQTVRKVASMLLAESCVEPFDDLIRNRERKAKQDILDKQVKEAEKQGKYLDPKPDVKLNPAIKLNRKGGFRNVKYGSDG
jgi:hypothetical protein